MNTMTPEECRAIVAEINAWLKRSIGFAWSGRSVSQVDRFTGIPIELYQVTVHRCKFIHPGIGTRYSTVTLFFVREPDGELHMATQETVYCEPSKEAVRK